MATNDKTSINLVGDGGQDEFCHPRKTVAVPEGVFFMAKGLRALLPGDAFRFNEPPFAAQAPLMRASLRDYDGKIRIAKYETVESPSSGRQTVTFHEPESYTESERRLLIAHHSGEKWRTGSPQLEAFVRSFTSTSGSEKTNWPGSGMPGILINLSSQLPRPHVPIRDTAPFESSVWNLFHSVCDQVGIVMSFSAIWSGHGAVSRRLSWEQEVEDLTAELHLFPRLKALTAFRHLFIRVGMVGFIHIERKQSAFGESPLQGEIFFAPYAKDGIYRDQQLAGTTFGRNTIFIAALVHAYQSEQFSSTSASCHALRDVCWRAVRGIRVVDDNGYPPTLDKPIEDSLAPATLEITDGTYLKHEQLVAATKEPEDFRRKLDIVVCQRTIPSHLLVAPSPNTIRPSERWHILDDVLLESPVHRINVAMAIVKAGHERVLNRHWSKGNDDNDDIWKTLTRVEHWNPKDNGPDFVTLSDDDMPATPGILGKWAGAQAIIGDVSAGFELAVPVATVGKLTAVEREEVEGLNGITNLLRAYATKVLEKPSDTHNWPSPISVAVFGPPGTGKTFAVKQIAKTLKGLVSEPTTSNVAQFRSIRQLQGAFKTIEPVKGNTLATVPILFFDEFDCAYEGTELGWLKSFLDPMTRESTPAILFFAGGVHASFELFDPLTDTTYENRRDLEEYKARVTHFVKQKGPDFTSRLRGYLNVPSIDDKPGRVKHVIRRALLLRSLLAQGGFINEYDDRPRIDDAIIYALLTVDKYRHGSRSMEAIIQMCPTVAGRIAIASLPSRAQLGMHVDAEEFLIRVHRGRIRSLEEWRES